MCLLILFSGFGDWRGDGGVLVDVFTLVMVRFWVI